MAEQFIYLPSNLVNHASDLKILRDRWEEWYKAGLPSCDPLLVDILPRFNSLINVVTVFGCSGHLDKGEDRFYMMFATDSVGSGILLDFHSRVIEQIQDLELRCNVDLKFGHAVFPVNGNDYTYPTIVFDVHFNGVDFGGQAEQDLILVLIENALTQLGV